MLQSWPSSPVPAQSEEAETRRSAFGVAFSPWGMDRIVEALADPVPKGTGLKLVVTANLDHIAQLTKNADFRAAYRGAWLAVIDGAPVLLYARLRGLPVTRRVTGAALFPALLDRLRPGGHRLFMMCPNEATAEALRARLAAAGFTNFRVVTAPPDFECDAAYGRWLVAAIREHRTTHLFFGVGAPKSEIWMHRHRNELPDCYGFGFGAALEYVAGTKRRAPSAFRRLGLEWLWRVASEPRRLAGRYFVDSWSFLVAVGMDLAGRPPGTRSKRGPSFEEGVPK